MIRITCALAIAVSCIAPSVHVSAIEIGMPADQPMSRWSSWPIGWKGLLNNDNRVDGWFGNGGSARCFYAGDIDSFNTFIKDYATLKGSPLKLIIHAGNGFGYHRLSA